MKTYYERHRTRQRLLAKERARALSKRPIVLLIRKLRRFKRRFIWFVHRPMQIRRMKERAKGYRQSHLEHVRKWARDYQNKKYATDERYRKGVIDHASLWRIKNPERYKEYHRKWERRHWHKRWEALKADPVKYSAYKERRRKSYQKTI